MADHRELLARNAQNIVEFRSSGGKLAEFGDAPIVLLTTVGTKSGEPRTSPVLYQPDDDDPNLIYVIASFAGSDHNPQWFNNIAAKPHEIVVERGTESFQADAETLAEPKRTEIYTKQEGSFSAFTQYRESTSRTIPVVALTLRPAG
jgi:deazaflavin-dependent oxidoreductase (nitroreductase family)